MRDWDQEEIYSKKELKQERKQLRQKDRSKYKKTDQRCIRKEEAGFSSDMKGWVVSIISNEIEVGLATGEKYICSLRGVLKKERTREKNPIIVGDEVLFHPLHEGLGVIDLILPRRSVLARQDNLHRIKRHLIAANVDQVFITQSCVMPPLKPAMIDRYLIAADKGGITPVLVCNKIDLLTSSHEKEKELLDSCADLYQQLGIDVVLVSAETGEGLDALREKMKEKISIFSGQSGTGKTSLINALTGLTLSTAPPVVATRKGAHTTSQAKLLKLPFGGYCVDTPGIRSFGIWDIEPDDIRHYFADFFSYSHLCVFRDCSHRHEPGCHIQKLVQDGVLSPLRYESYLNLYASLQETHRPR